MIAQKLKKGKKNNGNGKRTLKKHDVSQQYEKTPSEGQKRSNVLFVMDTLGGVKGT